MLGDRYRPGSCKSGLQELAYLVRYLRHGDRAAGTTGTWGYSPRGWGDLGGDNGGRSSRRSSWIADSGTSDPPEPPDKVYFVRADAGFRRISSTLMR